MDLVTPKLSSFFVLALAGYDTILLSLTGDNSLLRSTGIFVLAGFFGGMLLLVLQEEAGVAWWLLLDLEDAKELLIWSKDAAWPILV